MNELLIKQLALDYCCKEENIIDGYNHFTKYTQLEGRRKFQEQEEVGLKIVVVNEKILVTGREDIVAFCKKKYEKETGEWFMEIKKLIQLNNDLKQFGFKLEQVHPFFVATEESVVETSDIEIVRYDQKSIEQFKGDERFSEAYAFGKDTPDVLGVGAFKNRKVLGMAGASKDSKYLWQMGINVMPESRGKNIATMLVTLLKNDILCKGKIPYYGTALSHIDRKSVV